jgi:hypothetical protein
MSCRDAVLCDADSCPNSGASDDPHHLAFHHMRPGPSETLPEGAGCYTHLLVVAIKFTKWIEVRPLAKIGSKQAIDFIQDIILHFGIPNSILTDNGTQFNEKKILDFYDYNNIRVDWPWSPTCIQIGRSSTLTA